MFGWKQLPDPDSGRGAAIRAAESQSEAGRFCCVRSNRQGREGRADQGGGESPSRFSE